MHMPESVYTSEEQVRQWHAQARTWTSNEEVIRRAVFLSWFVSKIRSNVLRRPRWIDNTTNIPVTDVLEAVARGELPPKAAQRLLYGHVSTLALLQSVAWGEISPGAARYAIRRT